MRVFPCISCICVLSCISRAFCLHSCAVCLVRPGFKHQSMNLSTWYIVHRHDLHTFAFIFCIYVLLFVLYFVCICIKYFCICILFLVSPGFNNLSANSCVWSGCTYCSLGCFCVLTQRKYKENI